MAQITQTKNGFKLADSVKLKGEALACEFAYEMTGELGCDAKAAYFEKLRAYFAQEAAQNWNKAKVKAEKKMQSKFEAADKEFGKFVKNVEKYNIQNPAKTIKDEENKYSAQLSDEMRNLIMKDIGPDFIQASNTAAEKRLLKEGTKLKKSKAKIAFSIGKVFVKVAAIAAAAIATAATGGAAAPVLVAVAVWVAFSFSTAKKLAEAGKIVTKLTADAKKDTTQMEKKLAELDAMFADCVKFANRLESKADAMEMEADKVKAAAADAMKTLSDVDPKSKEFSPKAKELQGKVTQLDGMMRDFGGMRGYAPKLRESFFAFRKVKNEATWGTKLESSKKVASFLNDIGKGLAIMAKQVDNAT